MKFKKYFALIIVSVFVLSFVVNPLGQVVNAEMIETETETDEELVAEIAEKLEFIWEEASIKDQSGKIIGFDVEKLKNKYGATSEDLEAIEAIQLVTELNLQDSNLDKNVITPFSAAVDKCTSKKVSSYFGAILAPAVWSAIYELMWEGEYTEAAKRLGKIGVRGNVFAIAGSLTAILLSCIHQEEGWI